VSRRECDRVTEWLGTVKTNARGSGRVTDSGNVSVKEIGLARSGIELEREWDNDKSIDGEKICLRADGREWQRV
jgi:hypothetical protein